MEIFTSEVRRPDAMPSSSGGLAPGAGFPAGAARARAWLRTWRAAASRQEEYLQILNYQIVTTISAVGEYSAGASFSLPQSKLQAVIDATGPGAQGRSKDK